MENCKVIKRCRACGSDSLSHAMYVGHTELANSFLCHSELGKLRPSFPLDVVRCDECGLAQLTHVVSPELLYRDYNYVTSTSRKIDEHLSIQCNTALSRNPDAKRVLEIASNTGVALLKYKRAGMDVLGVDPAKNIAKIAQSNGVNTIAEFFGESVAKSIGKFDIILARHVLAHIDDWEAFSNALAMCCHENTEVILEFPYVVDTISGCQFDTIYHEHLSYISVGAVRRAFYPAGLHVKRVTPHPTIHGGSIEVVLSKSGSLSASNYELMEKSSDMLCGLSGWSRFSSEMSRVCGNLVRFISSAKAKRKSVIGYGASARGNTLLNVCGIRNLDFIIDNTPFKIGKYAPQSEIPIVHPESLLESQPDFAIVTAWTFYDEIAKRESEYTSRGGVFINPIQSIDTCRYR